MDADRRRWHDRFVHPGVRRTGAGGLRPRRICEPRAGRGLVRVRAVVTLSSVRAVWQGRVPQVAAKYGVVAPSATACNACRACVLLGFGAADGTVLWASLPSPDLFQTQRLSREEVVCAMSGSAHDKKTYFAGTFCRTVSSLTTTVRARCERTWSTVSGVVGSGRVSSGASVAVE